MMNKMLKLILVYQLLAFYTLKCCFWALVRFKFNYFVMRFCRLLAPTCVWKVVVMDWVSVWGCGGNQPMWALVILVSRPPSQIWDTTLCSRLIFLLSYSYIFFILCPYIPWFLLGWQVIFRSQLEKYVFSNLRLILTILHFFLLFS